MSSDADKMWAEMTGGAAKPAGTPSQTAQPARTAPPAATSPVPSTSASDTDLFPPSAPVAPRQASQPASKPGIPAAAIYVAGAVVIVIALVLVVWMFTSKRAAPATVAAPGGQPSQSAAAPSGSPAPSRAGMINLNTATAAQLRTLPDVGPAMADKIIEYRTKRGSFRSVEELDSVSGIGPKTMAKLRPLVYVE